MPRTKKQTKASNPINENTSSYLFELPPPKIPEPLIKTIRQKIWTENKARLIERYLYYFVLITRHGCYIDGFAGPQDPSKPESWAAKLVLETEPKWLRQFHLFEADKSKIEMLSTLQKKNHNRKIQIYAGDFNYRIKELLSSCRIKQKEATFCLLDQRTFECHWSSLQALAEYKTSGSKIELFYFFANAWLDRALAAQRDESVLHDWWGSDEWSHLRNLNSFARVQLVVNRFKQKLGYNSVKAWPIYEKNNGGHIMYYMIHATDHPDAPLLMSRAYEKAVKPKEPLEQISLELGI